MRAVGGGELGSLARRENQLVTAQEQRVKSSGVQAFWYGYGQGDGKHQSWQMSKENVKLSAGLWMSRLVERTEDRVML